MLRILFKKECFKLGQASTIKTKNVTRLKNSSGNFNVIFNNKNNMNYQNEIEPQQFKHHSNVSNVLNLNHGNRNHNQTELSKIFTTIEGAMFRERPNDEDQSLSNEKVSRLIDFLRNQVKITERRIVTDPARRLAYGTDASLYRLVPKLVVDVENEKEVSQIITYCNSNSISITFRAAGTSLSGQACTDSVLVRIVPSYWNRIDIIGENATSVRLQPGVVGSAANQALKMYQKKIGPDPASIDHCMIGGIIANNSSGMCCGTAQNAYNTIQDIRLILADGSLLDTSDQKSVDHFRKSHGSLLQELGSIAKEVESNPKLVNLINKKYSIKNTTGIAINSFVDHRSNPLEILKHIMVGSEGTLGFISDVTLKTFTEKKLKAASLLYFPNFYEGSAAVKLFKENGVLAAAEIMDSTCLDAIRKNPTYQEILKPIQNLKESDFAQVACLLVEIQADDAKELESKQQIVSHLTSKFRLLEGSISEFFLHTTSNYHKFWHIRKAMYPLVGAMRSPNTSVVIEDIAVPLESLAQTSLDLGDLFRKYNYHDAKLFGHALDGNFHICFSQSFADRVHFDDYEQMMEELYQIVCEKHEGSFKAEHGTGRNIAPFVSREWGKDAYSLMERTKKLLDPNSILNRGVIFTQDPLLHTKNIKPMPSAHPIVDKCMECGNCERACPSKELSTSPRQRIVMFREISRLRREPQTPQIQERLSMMLNSFDYEAEKTCAADGMCSVTCPVQINTGELIRHVRQEKKTPWQSSLVSLISRNFGLSVSLMRLGLSVQSIARSFLGDGIFDFVHKYSKNWIPKISALPKAAPSTLPHNQTTTNSTIGKIIKNFPTLTTHTIKHHIEPSKVVYFVTCVNRMFGTSLESLEKNSLQETVVRVLNQANMSVVFPKGLNSLCCGMAFGSKGFGESSAEKTKESEIALWEISEQGKLPILVDASPCTLHLVQNSELVKSGKIKVYDQLQFVTQILADKMEKINNNGEKQQKSNYTTTAMIHIPCSNKRMGESLDNIQNSISKCCGAGNVHVVDSGVPCCGMGGDRGLWFPELPHFAQRTLRRKLQSKQEAPVKSDEVSVCVSSSKTCEISLSDQSGREFKSIFYLIDQQRKQQQQRK